jgi:aldehyde dehydrogenase (NAD+)
MKHLDRIYIDGGFVKPHGDELFPLYNPATEEQIGLVRLGDASDARLGIAAAKKALPAFARTSKAERIELLRALYEAVNARVAELTEIAIEEYGAPTGRAVWTTKFAAEAFLNAVKTLEDFSFTRVIGNAGIVLQPVGVVGIITPWNANYGFICNKLATALSAGCTCVIKPSEMSATQTDALTECLHAAGLPAGVFNIITGRGDVVGAELTTSPDVAKISFTGSTAVGKSIMRDGAETMKRVTLELGGKSPTIILDDADLDKAVTLTIQGGMNNNGQACVNGTRVLIPAHLATAFGEKLKTAVEAIMVGDPRDPQTALGPVVSQRQYDRVESYIRAGIEEGATLLTGGEGRPEGLDRGFFVKPTVFTGVSNTMKIAREEIFGPVLAVLTYETTEEAIAIANDTTYGLQAYVISADHDRAVRVAQRIEAGRVIINGAPHEPLAPFGGFKQSGIGREYGVFGLETFLETKAILGSVKAA